jgi:hypothetical protein
LNWPAKHWLLRTSASGRLEPIACALGVAPVAIKMVLQVAVRDIGQLTDLALQPDEPLIEPLIGA